MLDYYLTAKNASKQVKGHEGLEFLQNLIADSSSVLDVGCGEGTRSATLAKKGWGVDINSQAIVKAKKAYPYLHFKIADATYLPFTDDRFDVVYSAFVLEHTLDPAAVLQEMVRVSRKYVIVLCPNFGAPNRRSPVSTDHPFKKFFGDILFPKSVENWRKVQPKKVYEEIDDDTTIEPELKSLLIFFREKGLKIIKWSSMWSQESPTKDPRKLFFKLFPHLGPQIFVVAVK